MPPHRCHHHHRCLVGYKTLPPLVFHHHQPPRQNPRALSQLSLHPAACSLKMADDAPHAATEMTPEEVQAEVELRMLGAAEGKQFEKPVSDESQQETSKVDKNVNCLGQKGTSPSSTHTTAISNGAAPVDNVKSPDGPDSSKQKQELASGVQQTPDYSKQKPELTSCDKSQEKKPVGKKHSSDLKSEKLEPVTVSRGRATRQLNKDAAKSSSTKVAEGEYGEKQQKTRIKFQKEDVVSDEDTDEDLSLKEMVARIRINKSKGQQEDGGASSKRKRLQEALETPLSKKNKMLDENLVGSRIKVWWPDDKMFYAGIIESFDSSSKKHKVSYDDGDVEVLALKKERWEFVAEQQDTNPDAPSNIPRGRKAKGSSGQPMKGEKPGMPQSGADVKNPPKMRARPKGVRSSNSMSKARLKGKGAEKDTQETPKAGVNSYKERARPSRSTGKSRN